MHCYEKNNSINRMWFITIVQSFIFYKCYTYVRINTFTGTL